MSRVSPSEKRAPEKAFTLTHNKVSFALAYFILDTDIQSFAVFTYPKNSSIGFEKWLPTFEIERASNFDGSRQKEAQSSFL